jgi:hypothetical protein
VNFFSRADSGSGPPSGFFGELWNNQRAQNKRKPKSPYQPNNRMANVVFNETGTIQGDTQSLHNMRVDTAHVYMNVKHKSAFQGQNILSAGDQTAIANGINVTAYNDSVSASAEALSDPSDPTNGAIHFFVLDLTPGRNQNVPSWAEGNETRTIYRRSE